MESSQARRNLIGQRQGAHSHSYAQILLGWRGQMNCEFSHGGYRLQAGNAAMVPRSAAHLYQGLDAQCELLVIDLAENDPYLQALEQASGLQLHDGLLAEAGQLSLGESSLTLLDFAARQLQQNPHNPVIHTQLVTLFLTQLSQTVDSSSRSHRRLDLTRLHQLVDNQLSCPPDNSQLAANLNLSESHLYCLCQQQLGVTPQQYIRQRRMQHARRLLLETDIPLNSLAQQLGFADSASFSRAWKKTMGSTPGALRRQQRNKSTL